MTFDNLELENTYGKMQLDSAIDDNTNEPLYPSIILTNVNYNLRTTDTTIGDSFDESILLQKGTEIISFLKLVDHTFIQRCIVAQTQAIESGTFSDPVDFYFPAFVEDYSFGFRFTFRGTKQIRFEAAVNLREYEGNDFFVSGDSSDRPFNYSGLIFANNLSDTYDLFNTSNSYEIYICINPYSDGTDNMVIANRVITSYNDLSTKLYSIRGGCSIADVDVAKDRAHDIVTRIFRNHTEPVTKVPIGTYEYVGKNTRDDMQPPSVPTSSILVGMHNMYKLNAAELLSVSKALWSNDFYDNLLKIFNDPMESIVSLALCPLEPEVYDTPVPIVVGNVELKYTPISQFEPIACTGLSLAKQYSQYNCGDIILYEEYRNYLDYNTKVEIYLPFIGIQTLNVEDVMNTKLTLKYNVDFFTGDCVAYLHCYRPDGTLDSTLYQWDGNILCNVPVSASNYSQTIMTGINTVVGLAGAKSLTSVIGGAAGMLGAMKPDIEKGGSMGSTKGALGIFEPHLIITKQIEDKPFNYDNLKGKPDNTALSIVKGLGLVTADSIHIKGINATQEEKDELESLFKSGVIL